MLCNGACAPMLQAACLVFWRACEERGLEHCLKRNFTLSYDTNVPRQAGLSGSSAIVCAALNCLLDFYGMGDKWAFRHPLACPPTSQQPCMDALRTLEAMEKIVSKAGIRMQGIRHQSCLQTLTSGWQRRSHTCAHDPHSAQTAGYHRCSGLAWCWQQRRSWASRQACRTAWCRSTGALSRWTLTPRSCSARAASAGVHASPAGMNGHGMLAAPCTRIGTD